MTRHHLVRSSGDARPLAAKSRALGDAELAVGEADPAFPLLVMTVDTGC